MGGAVEEEWGWVRGGSRGGGVGMGGRVQWWRRRIGGGLKGAVEEWVGGRGQWRPLPEVTLTPRMSRAPPGLRGASAFVQAP